MRWINPNYTVDVNADGGYDVLVKLGFKPEGQARLEEQREQHKAKFKAWCKEKKQQKEAEDRELQAS